MNRIHAPRLRTSLLLYPPATGLLLVTIAGALMGVRSHRVAEAWGWATVADYRGKPVARYVYFRSAQGGLGIEVHDYRNTRWATRSPLFHSSDEAMQYPRIAARGKAVQELRFEAAGFAFCRSHYHRQELWMEHDGVCYPADDAMRVTCIVPWWSITVAGLLIPGLAVRHLLCAGVWYRRGRRGACPACGYDLRATPARCPECGRAGPVMREACRSV
jgi:hypothetical protein